ncbi:DUF3379 domain-containing protein [Shewanella salipaludis]|uniref:DUF3379 domain-containing protein n=1 Tax=Shewanella salipaludis TaxID=2723052 RepID=A0A972FTQ0_9GAMM|nr:DUF3379 domain-containing protein [Shewanella salipaludis]NMH66033.1 DUF3379 domain-containing protein [Shewanella salipaludis]
MDELQFRRQAYGEPNSQDAEFLQALQDNPDREVFLKELKQLDGKLDQALKVEIPDGMADKLLLRQQLQHHQQQKRKTGFMMAMVASVAFVVGISFSLLRIAPVDLGEHALAHVHHETVALVVDQHVGVQQINAELAAFKTLGGAKFSAQPGKVYYLSYCDFQGVQSLHLVMQGAENKVTAFLVPQEDRMLLEANFADKEYQGMGFQRGGSYILLVGERQADLDYVKAEITQTFI